jgi:hypothetical protein
MPATNCWLSVIWPHLPIHVRGRLASSVAVDVATQRPRSTTTRPTAPPPEGRLSVGRRIVRTRANGPCRSAGAKGLGAYWAWRRRLASYDGVRGCRQLGAAPGSFSRGAGAGSAQPSGATSWSVVTSLLQGMLGGREVTVVARQQHAGGAGGSVRAALDADSPDL